MTCEVCHSPEAERIRLKAALTDGRTFIDICEKCFNIIKQNYSKPKSPEPANSPS